MFDKIQQHCYTRSKRGLFSQSAGYDTVARSAGLTEDFIKSRLHPFCYYHPSKTLQALRVPAEEFPRALTVIQFPEGLMLLGQTVYVNSDFTGQRPTFFTHNYILPRPAVLTPGLIGTMLNFTVFLTETDWEKLTELEELPRHFDQTCRTETHTTEQNDCQSVTEGCPPQPGTTCTNIGPLPFDEGRLRQLVYGVLEAIMGTKKVYVILPDLEWVYPMLMWLYSHLPASAAQILGFTTYSREPENKKFLHLVFVEKGILSLTDSQITRDYVFDFDSGLFSESLPEVTEEILQGQIEEFILKFAMKTEIKDKEELEYGFDKNKNKNKKLGPSTLIKIIKRLLKL